MPDKVSDVLPQRGSIIPSIRSSCEDARISSGIKIHNESIQALLHSQVFKGTFDKLRRSHGVTMPLNFKDTLDEVNLISILSLLNFCHGYRIPLHKATGRGAYDTIRVFVFGLYLTSSDEDDLISANGLKSISSTRVADLMQLTNHLHVEKPHPTNSAITIGELGPLYELVTLVTKVMNETGDILVNKGYASLGAFVVHTLQPTGNNTANDMYTETILDQIIGTIPAFQDVGIVDGKPVYIFKKALFLLHALQLRFESNSDLTLPDTSNNPIFSDNVIPSMLVHLGILDLSNCTVDSLRNGYRDITVEANLDYSPTVVKGGSETKEPVQLAESVALSTEAAYVLRAAAVDACEKIVAAAKLSPLTDNDWVITLPELNGWLWSIAKVGRFRALMRFAETGTVMY